MGSKRKQVKEMTQEGKSQGKLRKLSGKKLNAVVVESDTQGGGVGRICGPSLPLQTHPRKGQADEDPPLTHPKKGQAAEGLPSTHPKKD